MNRVRPSPVSDHNFLRHRRESVLAGQRLIPVVSPSSLRGVLGMRVYSGEFATVWLARFFFLSK